MKKQNRTFLALLKPTCFVIVLAVVLCGVSSVLDRTKDVANVKAPYSPVKMIQHEEENTVDILTFGNSDLWASFDPMFLWKNYGYTSINGATPGQAVWDAYFYLLKSLKTQSPKMLVLETDMIFPVGVLNKAVTNAESAISSGVQINTLLIKNHNRWKSLFLDKKDKPERPKNTDFYTKGYNLEVLIAPYEGDEYMTFTDQKEKIPSVVKIFLDRILVVAEKNNIKIFFYETLTTNLWTTEKSNAVKHYAEKNGIDYFDFNLLKDQIGLNLKTDTRDRGVHLNHSGAEKVTRHLGKYIEEQNILASHKSDANYEKWNELEKKYDAILEQKYQQNEANESN